MRNTQPKPIYFWSYFFDANYGFRDTRKENAEIPASPMLLKFCFLLHNNNMKAPRDKFTNLLLALNLKSMVTKPSLLKEALLDPTNSTLTLWFSDLVDTSQNCGVLLCRTIQAAEILGKLFLNKSWYNDVLNPFRTSNLCSTQFLHRINSRRYA